MIMKPIIPEVCDRLKCKIPSCYGWDFCREAREELTETEWDKFFKIFCSREWIVESKKVKCPIEPRCMLNVLFPNCEFDCMKVEQQKVRG